MVSLGIGPDDVQIVFLWLLEKHSNVNLIHVYIYSPHLESGCCINIYYLYQSTCVNIEWCMGAHVCIFIYKKSAFITSKI